MRHIQHAPLCTNKPTKVFEVAGKKVRCTSADCSEQYGPIFIGQLYVVREERVIRRGSGGNDLYGAKLTL
jgi:hypothetical protein